MRFLLGEDARFMAISADGHRLAFADRSFHTINTQ